MDLYGSLLRHVMFPAFEELRGRPTVGLLRYLERSQWASTDELTAIQDGFVRRLTAHAYAHTAHYNAQWDALGVGPHDLTSAAALAALPVLDREPAITSADARLADAPPRVAIVKRTSGSTGRPMTVKYNAESRHWRDADRWRGYGWANYRVGDRALHYWGAGPTSTDLKYRARMFTDRAIKRDLYVDAGRGEPAALDAALAQLRRFCPSVLVVFTQAAVRLAHHVIDGGLRTWDPIPVLCGAEKVWPADRAVLEAAFGPVFETYGCREVQLIGAECEHHDGLHVSVEKLVVELVVRAGGTTRAARPGEVGEVVVTDLHNLAQPLIRYATGDVAVARSPEACACGRTLPRLGSVEGRVAEMLYDRDGNPVSGLLFSIVFVAIAEAVQQFQVAQLADRSLALRVVPHPGGMPPAAEQLMRDYIAKYLPGIPMHVELVDDIPVAPSGKRRVVVVDPAAKRSIT